MNSSRSPNISEVRHGSTFRPASARRRERLAVHPVCNSARSLARGGARRQQDDDGGLYHLRARRGHACDLAGASGDSIRLLPSRRPACTPLAVSDPVLPSVLLPPLARARLSFKRSVSISIQWRHDGICKLITKGTIHFWRSPEWFRSNHSGLYFRSPVATERRLRVNLRHERFVPTGPLNSNLPPHRHILRRQPCAIGRRSHFGVDPNIKQETHDFHGHAPVIFFSFPSRRRTVEQQPLMRKGGYGSSLCGNALIC